MRRSLTECGVSACYIKTSAMRRPRPQVGLLRHRKKNAMKGPFFVLHTQARVSQTTFRSLSHGKLNFFMSTFYLPTVNLLAPELVFF